MKRLFWNVCSRWVTGFLCCTCQGKWFFSGFKTITLKGPFTTAADDNFFFFFFYFTEKTSLDISCESSAWQMIHMKCQDLFSLKNEKKFWMSSAANFASRFKCNRGDPFFFLFFSFFFFVIFQRKLDLAFHVNHLPYFLWKRKKQNVICCSCDYDKCHKILYNSYWHNGMCIQCRPTWLLLQEQCD